MPLSAMERSRLDAMSDRELLEETLRMMERFVPEPLPDGCECCSQAGHCMDTACDEGLI